MKRFSQQKYDDSKRLEYLDKKQRENEETRRAHADKMKRKQEYLDRKKEMVEENIMLPRKIYGYKHQLVDKPCTLRNKRMIDKTLTETMNYV